MKTTPLLLSLTLVLGLARPAVSAIVLNARGLIEATTDQAQKGDVNGALKKIETVLRTPGRPESDRARLRFHQAWLYSNYFDGKIGTAMAINIYEALLKEYPKHVQTRENLIGLYRRGKEIDLALKHIAVLLRNTEDNERKAGLQTMAGDVHADAKHTVKAYLTYVEAHRLNPKDDVAATRVVDMYPAVLKSPLGPRWLDHFFATCEKLEKNGQGNIALKGYGSLARLAPEDSDLALKALVHWIEIKTASGTLDHQTVENRVLFNGTPVDAGWQEFRHLMMSKVSLPTTSWKDDLKTRITVSRAMLSVARNFRTRKDFVRAEAYARAGKKVAPSPRDYDRDKISKMPVPYLDCAMELATLYHLHPKLDPQGRKFEALEHELIGGKNMAYIRFRRNLGAIEKFHRTLGQIYAERDRWEGGIRGAPYHLGRAVSSAKRRNPAE
ncbi:MAG: hypothetical protein AAF492_24965, partial [Verrucomicrobiota bacterium]